MMCRNCIFISLESKNNNWNKRIGKLFLLKILDSKVGIGSCVRCAVYSVQLHENFPFIFNKNTIN
jgi:hypothetical protein